MPEETTLLHDIFYYTSLATMVACYHYVIYKFAWGRGYINALLKNKDSLKVIEDLVYKYVENKKDK